MRDWKKSTVLVTSTIREAIELIDSNALQIALVVDEENHLLGTVTDGDIRRSVLRGVSLETGIDAVMNKEPVSVDITLSAQGILDLMKKKDVRQMPVLDENRKIVGLEMMEDLLTPMAKENAVVLMAGGRGSRLKHLTEDLPKPLLEVGNKPILETILENFIDHGFSRFYIAVNYKNEMIQEYFGKGEKWGVQIDYLIEEEPLGTAGALSLMPETPKHPLIVMNGDLLTKVNFAQVLDYHESHEAEATLCIRDYEVQLPFGVVDHEEGFVTGIKEKPIQKCAINAGIYVLNPSLVSRASKAGFCDMTQLLMDAQKEGAKVAAYAFRDYWIDIGRLKDLEKAQGDFSQVFNT